MTLAAVPHGLLWLHLQRPQPVLSYHSHAPASQLTSFELCLTVPGVLLQALLLIDDDVLDVLHRQVVTEGVEQNVFQLLQGDSLHVELQEEMRNVFLMLFRCAVSLFLVSCDSSVQLVHTANASKKKINWKETDKIKHLHTWSFCFGLWE